MLDLCLGIPTLKPPETQTIQNSWMCVDNGLPRGVPHETQKQTPSQQAPGGPCAKAAPGCRSRPLGTQLCLLPDPQRGAQAQAAEGTPHLQSRGSSKGKWVGHHRHSYRPARGPRAIVKAKDLLPRPAPPANPPEGTYRPSGTQNSEAGSKANWAGG